jgi:hypothetical protein
MKNFIASTKRAFDLVIFDAPMALSIPEVALLAPEMDGVLLVHRPRQGDKNVVLEAKKLIDRTGATLIGVVLNNVREKDIRFYYPYRYQDYYAYRQNGLEYLDMQPVEPTATGVPETLTTYAPAMPPPVHVEATSRSGSLSLTLNTVCFLDCIGDQVADANMHFLVLEVTLENHANSPYVFYPEAAVILTEEENNYDRALASLIGLPNHVEESKTQSVEEVDTYKYHKVTRQIEGGLTGDEFILPNGKYKGSLVYQIPIGARNYIFKYTDSASEMTIPFKKPSGNNHA